MFSNSVLALLAFGAFLYLGLRFFQGEVSRRLAFFSLAGGLLFAALTAFGFSLNYTDTIWNPEVFPALLCLTPFFGVCTGFGLRALSGGGVQKKENGLWLAKLSDRQFYLFCASALFLAWVPVLLAAWPGIFLSWSRPTTVMGAL